MPVNLDQARAWLVSREERRQRALDLRFAEAWGDFRRIVGAIVRAYPVRRLYQWGSLLDRRRFSERSDIDLAVEGVTQARDFFALFGEADRLTSFSLDLVAIEHIEPEYAALIREGGVLVYDREQPDSGPHFRVG